MDQPDLSGAAGRGDAHVFGPTPAQASKDASSASWARSKKRQNKRGKGQPRERQRTGALEA